ncbi:hypothetical protein [Streptacidiphilus jiangxiensis]|uniref:Uncharacterized protein n=1 Tax=Streptacidiphilus jiangxiensis TaxID=235985 RepID=A0A1H7WBP5_STRJI|nr:hypothetical protein [Streptacidiphilus jiangxiensis]SEM18505.1 hypothetical protein SAMN05414137_12035 [Streptacidiphilus jiangxiensis]
MDDTDKQDAVARALRACLEIRCPKCKVEPWQHCRNHLAGRGVINARFHKPRQVDSGAQHILAGVGIRHLRWQAPVTGRWTGEQVTG